MKNKLLIIAIIAAIGFAFTACGSDDSDSTSAPKLIEVANTAEWNSAFNAISGGGNNKSYIIDVSGDFSVDGTVFPASNFGDATGISVTLQGNGGVSLNSNGSIICLNSGQTLIIDGDLMLKGRSANDMPMLFVSFGKLELKKGTICGNTANTASGVRVRRGTFTMSGGSISGNTTSDGTRGCGVYVYGSEATFTMSGGTISGNTGWEGVGVAVEGGTFTMSGGSITGNTAGASPGGVEVFGTFTMSGGTISGNTAEAGDGGGLYIYGGDTLFTKTGGQIYGNDGGGNSNTAIHFMANGDAIYYHKDDSNKYYRDTTLNTNDDISTNQLPASGTGYNWTKIP